MTEIEKEPQRGFCAAQNATTRSENTANRFPLQAAYVSKNSLSLLRTLLFMSILIK
ncbi:MAG TPA: hypothetical protein VGB11_04830 [Candidatus Bathyarchaeia archaeon]